MRRGGQRTGPVRPPRSSCDQARAAAQLIIQVQALVEDLPEATVERLPSMTLREIRGMRNTLAHGYGDIDVAMMWDTISRGVPEFLEQVLQALATL